MKKIQKYLLPLLLTLFGAGLVWWDGAYHFRSERDEYIRVKTNDHTALYRSVLDSLRPLADTIYHFKIVENPEVSEIMAQAASSDEKGRIRLHWTLYRTLIPTYRYLLGYDIRQFHFHLPGNVSFLRFHRPDKYGDSLRGIRPSIDHVNRTRKIVRCFEEGRIFNGFRNVYPIFNGKKFVGTVEISFDAGAIIKRMTTLKPHDMIFFIDRSLVKKKVWKDERKNYRSTPLSERFLVDEHVMQKFSHHVLSQKILFDLMKALRPKVESKMEEGRSFAMTASRNGENYIVTFTNIRNCESRPAAYLVSFEKAPFVDKLERKRWTHFWMGVAFVTVVAFFLYVFLDRMQNHNEELEKIAAVDALTGCTNRLGFQKIAPMMVADARRYGRDLCLVFFDIDHFKKINDTHGHAAGDEVLRSIASFVRRNIRSNDLCVRWGGEEFFVMTLGISCEEAYRMAEKLRKGIEGLQIDPVGSVSASFGVGCLRKEENLESFIERVDEALYRSKQEGRNRTTAVCENA